MFLKTIFCWTTAIIFTLSLAGAELAKDGKGTAVILLGPEASGCARTGAQELQKFIEDISGAKLPVETVYQNNYDRFKRQFQTVILLGASTPTKEMNIDPAKLNPDGFCIKVDKNVIAIVGNDAKAYDPIPSKLPTSAGTLYGVYRFLEQLGVRFLQQEYTKIPKNPNLSVADMELSESPYFPYRIMEVMIDPWYRRVGYGADRDPWATRHSFHYWDRRFKKTHPEYFCMDENGKSDLYYPAFTHDGVIEQIVADAKAHFSKKNIGEGKRRFFLVLPNDYFMKMCSCEKCRALTDESRPKNGWYSDYVADAVVKVANAVKEEFPDCYIVYGAYERYQLPPTRISKLPDNVVVLMAGLRRASLPHWMPSEDKELLAGWEKLKPAGIYFWRYNTFGKNGVPWLMPHMIADSVKTMKAASEAGPSKVYGEMSFFRYDPQTYWWQNVNDYVNAKLLWNPDLDCDELLKQYFSDLYGPAAKEMGEFHDLLEKNYMTCSDSAYLPRETVEKLSVLLDSAEQKTANTEFAGRVEYVRSNFIALKKYEEMYHAQAAPGEVGTENILWRSPGETRFDGTKNAKVLEKPVTPGLEYTLEAWISPDDLTSRPVLYGESFNTFEPYYIFGSTMQDPTFNHIGLAIVGNCLMLNDNNLGQVKSKPLKLEKGKYYHVAAVGSVAGSQLAIYLDGEPVGLQTVLGTIVNRKPTKEPAPILVYGGGGDQQSFRQIKGVRGVFNGKIKDAAIYDKALSPAEVLNRSKQK